MRIIWNLSMPKLERYGLIPGSHKNPLHNDLRENLNELGLEISDVPGYVCKSEPGGRSRF